MTALVIVQSPFAGGKVPVYIRISRFSVMAKASIGIHLSVVTRSTEDEAETAARRDLAVMYARAAMNDCFKRGEAPIASHLLYTQPGVLDDDVPEERAQGIEAGLLWGRHADKTVVYTDLGISDGIQKGIKRAKSEGRAIVYRKLEGWS